MDAELQYARERERKRETSCVSQSNADFLEERGLWHSAALGCLTRKKGDAVVLYGSVELGVSKTVGGVFYERRFGRDI